MKKRFARGILFTLSAILVGCVSTPPREALEKVAKDWSMTIRASQIMPVYPLDEDIRPGDVYISKNDVDTEIATWEAKGFLPLINRYDRIPITASEYDTQYANGFKKTNDVSFNRAPGTAFPSYTFSVDKRGALGLAIPLNSVPVALSASGAQSATGSVVFKGASNQGLSDRTMQSIISRWAAKNQNLLASKYNNNSPTVLRVITRIYSIQGATVTLAFSEAVGTQTDVGAGANTPGLLSASEEQYNSLITYLNKQVELKKGAVVASPPPAPPISNPTTTDSEIAALETDIATVNKLKTEQQLQAIKQQIANLESETKYGGYILPGASFKVASRTARGVTMDENFTTPLVVGYLAMEYLILPSGRLLEVGSVEDLIEKPQLYQSLRSQATEVAKASTRTPQVDNPATPLPIKQ
ncbi:hypothetical protein [Pseudomonas sp. PD9R]|uniref:hypothetical protein n=1 Tax=Pseudomonas sp. PD9R TaxID=2853534 RepID=UPI001C442DC6|nr:hypothetical protein [Pseudomonas sp. PD9R]MBV6823559.1 hypothetical protein [Pseudomonas sp. PD9R]